MSKHQIDKPHNKQAPKSIKDEHPHIPAGNIMDWVKETFGTDAAETQSQLPALRAFTGYLEGTVKKNKTAYFNVQPVSGFMNKAGIKLSISFSNEEDLRQFIDDGNIPGDPFLICVRPLNDFEAKYFDASPAFLHVPHEQLQVLKNNLNEDIELVKKRFGPYPPEYDKLFDEANTLNLRSQMNNLNVAYRRNCSPERALTLHYALIAGASNYSLNNVDEFATPLFNGQLAEEGLCRMNYDLNSYPDAAQTIQAWYYGAYKDIDLLGINVRKSDPFEITELKVLRFPENDHGSTITLEKETNKDRIEFTHELNQQETLAFRAYGIRPGATLQVIHNGPFDPENFLGSKNPIIRIPDPDGKNGAILETERLYEISNPPVQRLSSPRPS